MVFWTVKDIDTGDILCDRAIYAHVFFERFKGLLGRESLEKGEGLIIPQCRSIHMFGMKFPIDVLFLDNDGIITKIVENLKPLRVAFGGYKTETIIELPAGVLGLSRISLGHRIDYFETKEI